MNKNVENVDEDSNFVRFLKCENKSGNEKRKRKVRR